MSNHEKRLRLLELKANPPKPPVYRVYLENGQGLLERWNEAGEVVEVLTPAQFDALPGRHIHIEPEEADDESGY